jgi:hypothetical protein
MILMATLVALGSMLPRMADVPEPDGEGEGDDFGDDGLDDDSGANDDTELDDDEDSQPEALPVDAIDEALIAEAASRGLSKEDVESFGSASAARRAISMIDRQLAGVSQAIEARFRQSMQQADGQQQQTPQQRAPQVPDFKLDTEVFGDEAVGKQFQALHEYHANRYQTLEQQVSQAMGALNQQIARREAEHMMERFDGLVEKWGDSYKDVLGSGYTMELPQTSIGSQNRQQIIQTAIGLNQAYVNSGQQPPRFEVLFERARNAVLGDKLASIERGKLAGQVRRRAAQVQPRGTSSDRVRPRKNGDGTRDAVAAVRERMKNINS